MNTPEFRICVVHDRTLRYYDPCPDCETSLASELRRVTDDLADPALDPFDKAAAHLILLMEAHRDGDSDDTFRELAVETVKRIAHAARVGALDL